MEGNTKGAILVVTYGRWHTTTYIGVMANFHEITMNNIFSLLRFALVVLYFSGCTTSEDIDLEDPSVTIVSPIDGASLNSLMELAINASDNHRVERILVSLNETPIAILEQEPFELTIDLSIYKSGSYTLRAIAIDPSGNSSEDSISLTIVNDPSLDRPIGLTGSKGTFGNKIQLDWEDIPNAKNYQIYRLNSESIYTKVAETDQSQFEDTDTFEPLTKVYYKVRVFNSNVAYSEFSDITYGYVSGQTYDLLSSFGSEGTGLGQFQFPEHLRLDVNNNIYVSDPNSNRIQKFGQDGSFKEVFYSCNSCRGIVFTSNGYTIVAESANNKIIVIDQSKQLVNQWGSFGTSDGQFFYFRQIALDNENRLYIVDHNNHRVQKFDLDGNFEAKWGSNGSGQGQFDHPVGITFYKEMVVVSSEKRIQFFTKSGEFIKQIDIGFSVFDLATDGNSLFIATQSFLIRTDETGEVMERIGEGDFDWLTGVGITTNGDIITSDVYKRKISVYRKN
ncbi:MAG: Ig-like domain-containing protein [Cyclobacteriaceae bacterium]